MSEMIERVAQAIFDVAPWRENGAAFSEQSDFYQRLTKVYARAAIYAMREPTDKMLHAATMEVPTWDNDASRRKWQAMVDVALTLQDSQP